MKLRITRPAYDYVQACIDAIDKEIGGLGYVRLDEDGTWTWYEAFVVPQEVSGASIDYFKEGAALAVERAAKDGVLGAEDHAWVNWHSHVRMDCYFSTTDVSYIEAFGEHSQLPYLFSYVGNKRRENALRLDVWEVPLVGHAVFTDIDLDVLGDSRIAQEAREDIKEHVRIKQWNSIKKDKKKAKDVDDVIDVPVTGEAGGRVRRFITYKSGECVEVDPTTNEPLEDDYYDAWSVQAWDDHELDGYTRAQLREMGVGVFDPREAA
jgi:proteasome lid subunit RPN8/RPN11